MRVDIVRDGRGFALRVDGRPYEIRGVGMSPTDPAQTTRLLEALVGAGGNTLRTWETAGIDALLEQAHYHDIAVLVGLGMQQQLGGFDYADAEAVAVQHRRIVADVERLHRHPAVLGWLIGNELNLVLDGERIEPAVWDAAAALVTQVQRIDPHHPVGATFALTASLADDLERAPTMDFIGLQAYGGLGVLPDIVAGMKRPLPYMVTEFGPVGHWEMPSTDWGREIEEPSGTKADGIVARLDELERKDVDGRLLGTFAFLWGQKQERTPTWYSLFTADGRRTATVDELQYRWTGRYPEHRAPRATGITLQGQPAGASVTVAPGQRARACVALDEPSDASLAFSWELRREVAQRSTGGHAERPAERVPLSRAASDRAEARCIELQVPERTGEYRLFVQVDNRHDGAATANLPFLVAPG